METWHWQDYLFWNKLNPTLRLLQSVGSKALWVCWFLWKTLDDALSYLVKQTSYSHWRLGPCRESIFSCKWTPFGFQTIKFFLFRTLNFGRWDTAKGNFVWRTKRPYTRGRLDLLCGGLIRKTVQPNDRGTEFIRLKVPRQYLVVTCVNFWCLKEYADSSWKCKGTKMTSWNICNFWEWLLDLRCALYWGAHCTIFLLILSLRLPPFTFWEIVLTKGQKPFT